MVVSGGVRVLGVLVVVIGVVVLLVVVVLGLKNIKKGMKCDERLGELI